MKFFIKNEPVLIHGAFGFMDTISHVDADTLLKVVLKREDLFLSELFIFECCQFVQYEIIITEEL